MNKKYYLGIDIGASSGRHIVGWVKENTIQTREVYRFENGVIKKDGHLLWDVDQLEKEVKKGIDEALKEYDIESLSIDTWGVDYVLMNNNETIYPVYAYRDDRTQKAIEEVHSIISFDALYKKTGCQFQTFNTIYQLYDDLINNRLYNATDFLMMPEFLMYKLTGNKTHEFTNATTTGLINSETLEYDEEIIDQLKFPKHLFNKLNKPKQIVGYYKGIKVVLCASHDTGSAVEGIGMKDNEIYISSGTWSLLGVKTNKPITDYSSMKANYSNEGGVEYNRYQKNIMGLWLVQELRREMCPNMDWETVVSNARKSSFEATIDVENNDFLSPSSMKEMFEKHLNRKDLKQEDYFRCAYESLALGYKKAIEELQRNTHNNYSKIYIVGGGAKNKFLNELTEIYTNKKVIALPIEATGIGNIKIQTEANK